MRFAVIGAGTIGKVHADVITDLSPHARIAAIVGRDAGRTASAADHYGAEPSLSLADTLARADIDAVAICTPSGSHAEIAVRALHAGKHVVVEKPLAITVDAAREVVEAQRLTGCTLTVVSQHRFDAASIKVHEAIEQGRLGRLTSAVVTVPWWRSQAYYDSGASRGTRAGDGGGAFLNQGIHAIDLLVWFLGTPIQVFAWTDQLAHERIEVEDTAVAALRFASGTLAVVHGATSAYPGLDTRLQIHGDSGSAIIEADQLTYLHTADDDTSGPLDTSGSVDTSGPLGTPEPLAGPTLVPREPPGILDPTLPASLRAQYEDFLSAVHQDHQPAVTAATALNTLSVVAALYRSAATGLPVSLSERDDASDPSSGAPRTGSPAP